MILIILKFFALIFALGTTLELLYNFPIMALDICIMCITIFLFYLLRILKIINKKLFFTALILGTILSIVNLLPISVKSSNAMSKYVNEKGIVETVFKGNIYREIRKNFKVKTITEFVEVAQIYFKIFFLKHFYLVFLIALFLSEIISMRSWFREKRLSALELS